MKILWLGDFFYDYDYISDDIKEIGKWIKDNDYITVLNLEGTIDCKNLKKIKKRGPNLSSNLVAIDVLKELNVVGVTLANNHIMDFGEKGLKHTIKLLDKNHILHTGAGINLEEALKPMILNLQGKKIAIYSFGWDIEETVYANNSDAGCAPRKKELFCKILDNNKQKYNRNIICPHWGFEYNRLPMPYDIEFAHSLIDSGCDLIIGNHPHCVQPYEVYKNKKIYYALGNFYFGSRRSRFNRKFKEEIINQSDYGVIVEYNCLSEKTVNFIINYSHEDDKSKLFVYNEKILKEITHISYNNYKYCKNAKKSKKNINPILTNNRFFNRIKLFLLFSNYRIKKVIKIIIRKK